MIPNVFVSSTVDDLRHLRESVRDAVSEIGYNPIMSEYGEIGYLPSVSAEAACYIAVKQCQLFILIIAKRYGTPTTDGRSVTHKEFLAAREARVPVITLIDKDVVAFKTVFDATSRNRGSAVFPGIDHPEALFAFIDVVAGAEVNNGFQTYSNAADARLHVKRQLAHFVGDLLQRSAAGLAPDIKDVVAEIKTLRHELLKSGGDAAAPFLAALRTLMSSRFSLLSRVLKEMFGDLVVAIPTMLQYPTFERFLQSSGWKLKIADQIVVDEREAASLVSVFINPYAADDNSMTGQYAVLRGQKTLIINQTAIEILDRMYIEVLREDRGAAA